MTEENTRGYVLYDPSDDFKTWGFKQTDDPYVVDTWEEDPEGKIPLTLHENSENLFESKEEAEECAIHMPWIVVTWEEALDIEAMRTL